jgi:hypothetical protein
VSPSTKTDNHSLRTKLDLRRGLLADMGLTRVRVLDVCAGAGHIWTAMREHVTVEQWTRCDIKPRQAGTLALTATQALGALPVDTFNVIDIDPYGEPWEAYLTALPRLRQATAIFLTRGHVLFTTPSQRSRAAVGLPADWPVPHAPRLTAFVGAQILSSTWRYGEIRHASVVEFPRVTYYALALYPTAANIVLP